MFIRALALVILCLAPPALAAPFTLDKDHTQITFRVSHLGFSVFQGVFREFDATIDFDPENIEATSVRFTIQSDSVDTVSSTRDDHIRSYPQLLDTASFPTITFVSTEVVLTSAETVRLSGDLTIKDQTHPIMFDVRLNASGKTPLSMGKVVYGFTAKGEVDRVKYGMGFAAPAVSAIVPVEINLEMVPVE